MIKKEFNEKLYEKFKEYNNIKKAKKEKQELLKAGYISHIEEKNNLFILWIQKKN